MSSDWPSLKSTFKYEPLNLDRPAFRLLRLKSARDSQATIECEIIQAYFDVEDVPDYEAISYTWGAINSPRKIRLDGSDFFVRFNLWSVLRDVRRQDEDRILWVDAICINQDDVRERGHQVQQIRHVYERAERVIFWLGQLTNPSIDILMDLLAELQGQTRGVSWSLTDPRWRRQWEQIPKGSLANLRSAFQEILERPWFRRVWILQEVANARAGLVHCGHKSMSAKIFAVCPGLLEIKPNQHCQAVLDVMPGPSRSGSWWEQDRRLHTLLRKFSETEATRDHDRVFALFGLCPEANAQITVDYTKSMPQLLRETVSYILKDNPSPYDIDSLPCFEYDSTETLLKDIDALHSRILEHLLEHESGDTVKDFLLQFQDQLAITPDLCVTAMARKELGNSFIASILHRNPQSPQVQDHQGRTPLLVATKSGNEVLMRVLIENGAECKDLRGFLPLYRASELGNEAIVRLLLDRGASSEITALDWNNPALAIAGAGTRWNMEKQLSNRGKISNLDWSLDTALSLRHRSVARLLLDHGAKAHESTFKKALWDRKVPMIQLHLDLGTLPTEDEVSMICERGNAEILRLLLDRGGSITPHALEEACKRGEKELVQLLLDRGGSTTPHALEEACKRGDKELIRLLLDRGASITPHALEEACKRGVKGIIRLLLDRGASITPHALEEACKRGDEELVQLLLDRGGSITTHSLEEACKRGGKGLIRLLLDRGGSITPHVLEEACKRGGKGLIQLLLDRGASVTQNALMRACVQENVDVVQLLVNRLAPTAEDQVKMSILDRRRTIVQLLLQNSTSITEELLDKTAYNGQEGMVRFFFDLGTEFAECALRVASKEGNNAFVRLLVAHPLDLDASSFDGETALSLASRYGHVDVARTLLDAGASSKP